MTEAENYAALKVGQCPDCGTLHGSNTFYDLSLQNLQNVYDHSITCRNCGSTYGIKSTPILGKKGRVRAEGIAVKLDVAKETKDGQ